MASPTPVKLSAKWLCFGIGIFGAAILAMFWMYPALLNLFGGAEIRSGVDGLTWFTPLLFLALMMSGWFKFGLLALLRPELVINILPESLKKGVKTDKSNGASSQFKHGRQFVLNSLAGRVVVWPAAFFAVILFTPVILANAMMSPWSGWLVSPILQILAFLIPAMFIAALLLRIFVPGIFSFINREPILDGKPGTGLLPTTAFPFIGGIFTTLVFIMLMSIIGLLPSPRHTAELKQLTERTNDGAMPNPAGNNPDTKPLDKETARKDVSKIKWEQHFLELLGENHVPVGDAFSTPFATFFRIDQPGYIPSGKFGPPDKGYLGPIDCAPTKMPENNNVETALESMRDAAEATTNSGSKTTYNPNCPRDLGQLWSSGSYVYDGTGNQLAGFEFKDNTHAYVVSDASGAQYLVFPEGGFSPKDNPAIKKIIPRMVFIRNTDPLGNLDGDDDSKVKIESYIPSAPNLPVTVSYEVITNDNVTDEIKDFLPDTDDLIATIEDIIKKTRRQTGKSPEDIIIISRAEITDDNAEYERRIQEISDRIKRSIQASNATFIHLGFLPKACYVGTEVCKIYNRRSTIIYSSTSNE